MIKPEEESKLPTGVESTKDVYDGVHLKLTQLLSSNEISTFVDELLKKAEIGEQKITTIWIHFKETNFHLLPLFTSKKFKIHHGLDDQIVVYRWMKADLNDLVVPYSVFIVAAGAIVIHQGKMLFLQQKNGERKGLFGIPGGRADRGEIISKCAQRQLFEQTGIRADFKSIVFFREKPDDLYGAVDIYFACLMQLNESSLEGFKLCPREIASHEWVELKDVAAFSEKNSGPTQRDMCKVIGSVIQKGETIESIGWKMQISQFQKKGELKKMFEFAHI